MLFRSKKRIYDSHARYAKYGLREREGQKFSALPLRTLADVFERFRLTGVLAFHFFLGIWITGISLWLERIRFSPSWCLALILGVWAALMAGAIEMTLLENLIRFSYGMARDAAIVLLATMPVLLAARRKQGNA